MPSPAPDPSSPPFLPYGRQCLDADDIAAVTAVLQSDWLTQGPVGPAFERELSRVVGGNDVVAAANGTAALHLCALALGLGPGDGVVVPSLTFLATANAVRLTGAEVAFADCDPETGLMRATDLAQALARGRAAGWRMRAAFPVHLTGQTVAMEPLTALAAAEGLTVVEDACHALGARYADGRPVGSGPWPTVFSFHPVKAIASAEGGAIATADPAFAARLRRLRNHGMQRNPDDPADYAMDSPGLNARLSDVHAALGLSQLGKLEAFLARRRQLADAYDQALAGVSPHIRPPQREAGLSAWHLYAVRIAFAKLSPAWSRPRLMAALRQRGIGTQVHYIPVHTQPYYRQRNGRLTLPGAEHYFAATLSLPLFPAMTPDAVTRVVTTLQTLLETGPDPDFPEENPSRAAVPA